MASIQAVAATGQAILGMLADACPRPEFAGARFELYQATDFATPMDEGISLYLYRVAINGTTRNRPPRVDPNGQRFRPSLPLDLHYLLSVWARTAARQQRLFGWAVRTLEDTPSLPAGLLNHYGPEADVFLPSESVELIADTITLQDLTNIWEPYKPTVRLSMAYVARMVSIDSTVALPDTAAQTRGFVYAEHSG